MRPIADLTNIACFLLDMDGTVYLGNKLLPGAREFLDLVRSRDLDYLLLTNNSSRHRHHYAEKLKRLGVVISENKIFTSGEATAMYLHKLAPGARVFVVGTRPLEHELLDFGFDLGSEDPDFVVLGFDTNLTYAKLWRLCDLVREGRTYIATHPDRNCPVENGFMPDIGATIAFVEASTGRLPDTIVGKPHRSIVEGIIEKTGLPVERLCILGDRLYTDIALGKHGMMTVLVLSGETQEGDIAESRYQPDFVMRDLAELTETLANLPQ